jgi:hypothetical protein
VQLFSRPCDGHRNCERDEQKETRQT